MTIASTRPGYLRGDGGVRGRVFLPVIAHQNELHVWEVGHKLFGKLKFVLGAGGYEGLGPRVEVAQQRAARENHGQ